jgi:hypothetical protein
MEPSPDGTQTPNLQLGATARRSAEAVRDTLKCGSVLGFDYGDLYPAA